MEMKAVLCEHYGEPEELHLKSIEIPKAREGHSLIQVYACGVNFPDALMLKNQYQFKPELPFSPGGEVCGKIIESNSFKVGSKVVALCGWGGFAEYIEVSDDRVFEIPDSIPSEDGAALLYNYATSFYALKDRAKILPKETILVLGAAGGVGLAAVELAVQMGARVIAAASSNEKIELCRKKGAQFSVNYSEENLKQWLKDHFPTGVDVVYDPIGGSLAEDCIRGMAWNGRYLVTGFASGSIPSIALNLALLKGCSIMGVFWGRFSKEEAARNMGNIHTLLRWYLDGKIKPHIYKEYDLEHSPEAIRALINREVKGKALIRILKEETLQHHEINTKCSFETIDDLIAFEGKSFGRSNEVVVDMTMIREFAQVTQDKQWIHLNGQESIAHGFLSLSLCTSLLEDLYEMPFLKMGINYGSNKVRFIEPVKVNDTLYLSAKLMRCSPKGRNSYLMETTIEVVEKQTNKVVLYAELLGLLILNE